MSSAGKHLRNAERHQAAALTGMGASETRAWAAVALFYSAHQLVHAVLDGLSILAVDMRHPTSHGSGSQGGPLGTNTLVARLFSEIDLQYKSLFAAGKSVRYDGAVVTPEDFEALLNTDFSAIAHWARVELEKQGRTLGSFPP